MVRSALTLLHVNVPGSALNRSINKEASERREAGRLRELYTALAVRLSDSARHEDAASAPEIGRNLIIFILNREISGRRLEHRSEASSRLSCKRPLTSAADEKPRRAPPNFYRVPSRLGILHRLVIACCAFLSLSLSLSLY